jgi:hypothetical protein
MAKKPPNEHTQTRVEMVELTPELIKTWKRPGFQRELRLNAKVHELVEKIKLDGGVVPGIITLGVLKDDLYKLDGQHRLAAFDLTKLTVGYADVRYYFAEDMADMGEEFVRLNSSLVHLRPDDILRGLEGHSEALQYIRKHAPCIGYDMIRRSPRAPMLSMSMALRCWRASAAETPSAAGLGAAAIARSLTLEEAKQFVSFINLAEKAWGRDPEYSRLYSGLTLTLCMWLFRRMVLSPTGSATPLSPVQFSTCLLGLSADARYLDYIVGRQLSDHDRSPAFGRIKKIFTTRCQLEMKKRIRLPAPAWASHLTGRP